MNNNKKIGVYVDGFNLYHGLKNLKKPHLKWLNLRSLLEKFIDKHSESIEKIYYFSAIATHFDNATMLRHQTYIEALSTENIEFVSGNFKNKMFSYKNNHIEIKWHKHEEKETDVNIAIYLLRDAIKKCFDKIILITNDTDIVPAIAMAKQENSALQFKLLTPPTLSTHDSLRKTISPGESKIIDENQIKNSLFSDSIRKPNGKIIRIPESYRI